MSNERKEQISAIMDDEFSPSQHDRPLDALSNESGLQQTWHRYHLIRDAIQGHLQQDVDSSLSDRVHAAIEREPAILSPAFSRSRKFTRPLAGLAIAASVAASVLLGVQLSNRPDPGAGTPAFASNAAPQTSQPVQFVSNNQPAFVSAKKSAPVESPMDRYLVNYNEYRANSGVRGMLPYVRIVGHETNQ
ncbi:MAG: sigma-E factor negative regulatory protein [Thiotrichales bacterium]|nr:sigma-E factor negative regulatory protein [Thiotrichales bacterium]